MSGSYDIAYGSSIATIFLDKLADLSLVVWVLVMIPFLHVKLPAGFKTTFYILLAIFCLCVLLIILSLVFQRQILARFGQATAKSNRLARFLLELIHKLVSAFKTFKFTPAKIAVILVVSVAIGLADGFNVLLLYLALGYRLPLVIAIFGALARYLLFAIPMPPAQIGSVELIWLAIYTGLFATQSQLVNTASVLGHSVVTLVTLALGTVGFIVTGTSFGKIVKDGYKKTT